MPSPAPQRRQGVPKHKFPVHRFRRRPARIPRGTLAAFAVVVGPGLLAGLSDDDPAGITTYSILGARCGYEGDR